MNIGERIEVFFPDPELHRVGCLERSVFEGFGRTGSGGHPGFEGNLGAGGVDDAAVHARRAVHDHVTIAILHRAQRCLVSDRWNVVRSGGMFAGGGIERSYPDPELRRVRARHGAC
jgi:hypothetical protein